MKTKRNILLYGLILILAVVLTAAASYGLADHLAHVREVEKAQNFSKAVLAEAKSQFKSYAESGDETAYWKAVSAFSTYVSIYEQFKDEDPERAEVANANTQVLYRLLSLMYSHEEACQAEMDSIRVLLSNHSIHPYGMWPGDLQEVSKLLKLCQRIEAAAKE